MSLEHKETMASTNMRSIFLALLFWVFPAATAYAATIQGKVVSVLDGDTIKVLWVLSTMAMSHRYSEKASNLISSDDASP